MTTQPAAVAVTSALRLVPRFNIFTRVSCGESSRNYLELGRQKAGEGERKQPDLNCKPPMAAPTPRVKWAVVAKKCTRRPSISGNTYMRVMSRSKGPHGPRNGDTKQKAADLRQRPFFLLSSLNVRVALCQPGPLRRLKG